jgi:hypothetical protein
LWSPQWKPTNRFQDFLLGAWTFTAIHTAETGVPFTVYQGVDVALDGSSGNRQHAQLVPGATVTRSWANENDMIQQYFNTAAFVAPSKVPAGVYGSSPRNFLTAPGVVNTDFSVFKDFRIHERYRLQFRAEFFNVFNTTHFAAPVATASSSTFGRITSAGSAREPQFALKLIW